MKYGHLELHIEELLKEKGISKNTICKELDIPRSNFNRYCRNEFQRLDAQLICKLCSYLDCEIEELIECVKEWEPVGLKKIRAGFCYVSQPQFFKKLLLIFGIRWSLDNIISMSKYLLKVFSRKKHGLICSNRKIFP